MRIDRRTLLTGLIGSGACWALKPVAGALSLDGPANVNDIYFWLHGLMGILVGPQTIRILSPKSANKHVYKYGRIVKSGDETGLVDLSGKNCSVTMPNPPAVLPPRLSDFKYFVGENVGTVSDDESAFSLTLPYPDEIIPIRSARVSIENITHPRPKPLVVFIPTAIIFHYKKVDFSGIQVTGGLPAIVANNGQPAHIHVFVEPDPTDEDIHDAQPDVDAMIHMFPGQDQIKITPKGADPCLVTPGKRHCHPLDQKVMNFPGATVNTNGVTEQMSIYEWEHKCGDVPPTCAAATTYETGGCPPHMLLMQGVSWPLAAAAVAPHSTRHAPAKKTPNAPQKK